MAQIRTPAGSSLGNYQQRVAASANMTPLNFVDPLQAMACEDARLSQLTGVQDLLYAANMHFSADEAETYARYLWQSLQIILGPARARP